MSDFHIVVIFNDYYTLIVAFLMKQIQNRYRNRHVATPHASVGKTSVYVSDFHIVVIFNDYYTLLVAFLTKQIQNRYRNRHVATPHAAWDRDKNRDRERDGYNRKQWFPVPVLVPLYCAQYIA